MHPKHMSSDLSMAGHLKVGEVDRVADVIVGGDMCWGVDWGSGVDCG